MKKAVISYITLFVVAAALVLYPKLFPITGNEMGYAVLSYIVIYPIAALFSGFLAGVCGNLCGILAIIITAVLSYLMPLFVFGSSGREYLLIPVVAAMLGFAVSLSVGGIKKNKE